MSDHLTFDGLPRTVKFPDKEPKDGSFGCKRGKLNGDMFAIGVKSATNGVYLNRDQAKQVRDCIDAYLEATKPKTLAETQCEGIYRCTDGILRLVHTGNDLWFLIPCLGYALKPDNRLTFVRPIREGDWEAAARGRLEE